MTVVCKKRRRRAIDTPPLGERLKLAALAARQRAKLERREDEKSALLAKAKEYELAYILDTSLSVKH